MAGEPWATEYGDGDTIAVPVDEPVVVPVAVENDGDRDGTSDATLAVDGEVADYRQSTLAAERKRPSASPGRRRKLARTTFGSAPNG